MTELMKDILRKPEELSRSLAYYRDRGRPMLESAARILRKSQQIYITGIGSSWHAGMVIQSHFHADGRPALLLEASELLHFAELAPKSTLIVLSRSGQSVEIVKLLRKAKEQEVRIIAITNTPESPLGEAADRSARTDTRLLN